MVCFVLRGIEIRGVFFVEDECVKIFLRRGVRDMFIGRVRYFCFVCF